MTKSFLIAVAVILTAPTAWAQVQNAGPQGSTGGNSVGAAINAPAPTAGAGANAGASTPGANAGASTQVQNAGPGGSTGSNNVGATLAAPANPAPSTATGTIQSGQSGRSHQ